jgi:Fic family protein
MEGNSYDFIDTEKLLVDGMAKEGATPEETTMVLNHHEAVRHMINNIHFPPHMNDLAITSRDVKEIHSLLSTHLLRDPSMCGAVRHAPVKIHQSSYIPLAVHDLIDRTLSTICHKAGLIEDPYEQAFFLLVHLPYLQPFEDCNKRTSRVICNIPLLRKGVAPMSWLDVDRADYNLGLIGIYERNNTSLLAEVFVDGYMHSTERFEIMQRTASPNEIQTRYRAETKQVIRSMILNGDNPDLSDIRPADIEPLHIHIERELNLLRSGNLGALVRYGLRDGDVESWMQDAGEVDSPRQRYTSSS